MSLFRQPYDQDGWFKIGRLQVTTTVGILLFGVAGTILGAFVRSLFATSALTPAAVFGLQVWRIFTWPWVDGIGIFTVLTWLFFYMFGNYVEQSLGRKDALRFYVGLWAIITVSYLVASLILPAVTPVFGLSLIQLLVVLIFIANTPRHVTFMGLPAWALGAIFVGLQLLIHIQLRDYAGILTILLSLAGTAIWAKTVGLLTHLDWVPSLRRQPRPARRPSARTTARPAHRPSGTASDEARLDQLLDKVHQHGLHSLTPHERKELEKISKRRRK